MIILLQMEKVFHCQVLLSQNSMFICCLIKADWLLQSTESSCLNFAGWSHGYVPEKNWITYKDTSWRTHRFNTQFKSWIHGAITSRSYAGSKIVTEPVEQDTKEKTALPSIENHERTTHIAEETRRLISHPEDPNVVTEPATNYLGKTTVGLTQNLSNIASLGIYKMTRRAYPSHKAPFHWSKFIINTSGAYSRTRMKSKKPLPSVETTNSHSISTRLVVTEEPMRSSEKTAIRPVTYISLTSSIFVTSFLSKGQTPEVQTLGDQSSEDQPSDWPSEDQPSEDQETEDEPSENEPSEDQPHEDHSSEDWPSEDWPSDDQECEDQETEGQSTEDQPSEDLPHEDKPSEDQTSEYQPYEGQPYEYQPPEDHSSEEQPYEDKPSEDHPFEGQPYEDQPSEDQPSEGQPYVAI
jgi:hypothetical protein